MLTTHRIRTGNASVLLLLAATLGAAQPATQARLESSKAPSAAMDPRTMPTLPETMRLDLERALVAWEAQHPPTCGMLAPPRADVAQLVEPKRAKAPLRSFERLPPRKAGLARSAGARERSKLSRPSQRPMRLGSGPGLQNIAPETWLADAAVRADVLRLLDARLDAMRINLLARDITPGSPGFVLDDPPAIYLLKEGYNSILNLADALRQPTMDLIVGYDPQDYEGTGELAANSGNNGYFSAGQPRVIHVREQWMLPDGSGLASIPDYLQACSGANPPCRELGTRDAMLEYYTHALIHESAHEWLWRLNYGFEPRSSVAPLGERTEGRIEHVIDEMFAWGVAQLSDTLPAQPCQSSGQRPQAFRDAILDQLCGPCPPGGCEGAAARRALWVGFRDKIGDAYEVNPISAGESVLMERAIVSRWLLRPRPIWRTEAGDDITGVSITSVRVDPDHPGTSDWIFDVCSEWSCQRVLTHCDGSGVGSECRDFVPLDVPVSNTYDLRLDASGNPGLRTRGIARIDPRVLGLSDGSAITIPIEESLLLPYPLGLGAITREDGDPPSPEEIVERVELAAGLQPPDPELSSRLAPGEHATCRPNPGQAGSCVEPIVNQGGCTYSTYTTVFDEGGNVIGFTRTDCFPSEDGSHCICSSPAFYGAPGIETSDEAPTGPEVHVADGSTLCRTSEGNFSAAACGGQP